MALIRYAKLMAGAPPAPDDIYVDGLPASVLPPAEMISRITVNADPFSAEYSDGDANHIEITTGSADRKLHFSLGGGSLGIGGGSPLAHGLHSSSHHFSPSVSRGRQLAAEANFTALDSTLIATAISELAHNILQYAGRGEISIQIVQEERRTGVVVTAQDSGPGISDLRKALRDGFSTSRGLGLGLPGARRMMDEFEIVSHPAGGTTVTVTKWTPAKLNGRKY